MRTRMIILAALAAAGTAGAVPILWDISTSGGPAATTADFVAGGVAESLDGAAVSVVTGGASMTDGAITLDLSPGPNGTYANGDINSNDGMALINDYVAFRNVFEAAPVAAEIGGLSAALTADTEYALYLWGTGDNTGQEATFVFGGATNQVSATADPNTATADSFVARYTFQTGAVVSDTLDFTIHADDTSASRDYAGFNGFAIVETIPEPGTLGLLGAAGAALVLVRRRFML